MKLLVIGSSGQLGWEICRQGKERKLEIIPFDIPEIDITDRDSLIDTLTPLCFDVLVNCSAYTAVDKAESDQVTAYAVNRDGPGYLAEICSERNIPIIHVSTDYVFSGETDSCNMETDLVEPKGVYGRSKAEGEARVRDIAGKHLIIRTSWLYGVHGNNFVKTMLRLGREREELKVVADQHGCPTFAADLAEAIMDIISLYNKNGDIAWGTYHFCGSGSTTWYGFASKIFEIAGAFENLKVKKVTPIETSEYPTPAERPKNSIMDCSMLRGCFNINPPEWEKSLEQMMERYYRQLTENR